MSTLICLSCLSVCQSQWLAVRMYLSIPSIYPPTHTNCVHKLSRSPPPLTSSSIYFVLSLCFFLRSTPVVWRWSWVMGHGSCLMCDDTGDETPYGLQVPGGEAVREAPQGGRTEGHAQEGMLPTRGERTENRARARVGRGVGVFTPTM